MTPRMVPITCHCTLRKLGKKGQFVCDLVKKSKLRFISKLQRTNATTLPRNCNALSPVRDGGKQLGAERPPSAKEGRHRLHARTSSYKKKRRRPSSGQLIIFFSIWLVNIQTRRAIDSDKTENRQSLHALTTIQNVETGSIQVLLLTLRGSGTNYKLYLHIWGTELQYHGC